MNDEYLRGYNDGQKAATDKYESVLKRIAEVDRVIPCTSMRDWRYQVKKMACRVLGIKHNSGE